MSATGPDIAPLADSRRNLSLGALTSPAFVLALVLLLLNDYVLKHVYPGFLTGKLSDFAGLFVFAVFWSSILPRRRDTVYLLTAVAFATWKSPFSQPAIDLWNGSIPWHVNRVVDLSDLAALSVLPFAHQYSAVVWRRRRGTLPIIAVSAFAFAATSYRTTADYKTQLLFDGTPEQFLEQLQARGITSSSSKVYDGSATPASYELFIPATEVCFGEAQATVVLIADGSRTKVQLLRMSHRCPERGEEKIWLYRVFTAKISKPLRLRPAA